MKNLNLNACGVSEMTTQEMKKIDGGFGPWAFFAIAAGIVALIYLFGGEGDTTVEVEVGD